MSSALAVRAFRLFPKSLGSFAVRRLTPKYTLGVQVLVRRPDGKFLLVQQSYRVLPFLPGGILRRREGVLDAARRELREETGIDAPSIVDVGCVHVQPGKSWVTLYAFTDVGEAAVATARPHGPEITQLLWVDRNDLPPVHPAVLAAFKKIGEAQQTIACL
jgi:8-oxo-dGTP pyrophosphatase MutT (NUDIX family)